VFNLDNLSSVTIELGIDHVLYLPGLKWPTVSAMLPFLTFSTRAPSLPDSNILPPPTLRPRIAALELGPTSPGKDENLAIEWKRSGNIIN